MKIISYTDLTDAQLKALEAFEKVSVQTTSPAPRGLATFHTFQGQHIQAKIDEYGVIQAVGFGPKVTKV